MKLVESFAHSNVQIGPWPSPCVVEDYDGYRIFITEVRYLGEGFWVERARRLGCVAILFEDNHWMARIQDVDDGAYVEGYPTFNEFLEIEARKKSSDHPPSSQFVHLHTHSEYSALDGLSTIQELVDRVKEEGQTALAITDHGVCAAHPELQQVAEAAGIKPIYGIEAYFVDDRLRRPKTSAKKKADQSDEEKAEIEADTKEVKDYWHLILWAQNDQGLLNLWAMSTEANRTGRYFRPRMDWDLLERYGEGVMCSTACLRGPVTQALLKDDNELAEQRLMRLKRIFGDRLYVELHTNQLGEQKDVNIKLTQLAKRHDVPLIAVCDSHYSCAEHAEAHRVWLAAQTNKTVAEDTGLFNEEGGGYHFMSEKEVREAISYLLPEYVDEAIANTAKVAERCTAQLQRKEALPVFTSSKEEDLDLLLSICNANWSRRTHGKTHSSNEYLDRFEKELDIIVNKGFCGYFLMVSDYCMWAKRRGILVGPGRGSGGGSLVAYLMGITEIDPVESELLFERFMTKGRKELPDFDIDFPSTRIDEVRQYMVDKYGENAVVRIGTHTRLKNKGSIEKMFMVHKGTSDDADWADRKAISGIIDSAESGTAGIGLTWEELWDEYGDALNPYRQKYPRVFGFADTIVGRLSTYGKHAAGIVISTDGPLTDRLPLRAGDDGVLISEFSMDALAWLGYIKFDFLAISTLDTLQHCVDLIKERTGKPISLYDFHGEYVDKDVWKFLSDGNTLGCFQIETPGGRDMTIKVQPKSLADLSDVVTIDRPGPMRSGLDNVYLARRHGRSAVKFADPRLETVLNKSYGVLLYQEDVMATCMVLAGYDDEQADYVRKILGKKKISLVEEEGRKFIQEAVERGMTERAAKDLWEQMAEFARYAFNRAHAFAYAVVAYWTGYLKYHYPLEFAVAVMTTVAQDRVGTFINDALAHGHKVALPDINRSKADFTLDGDEIVYALTAIKGVGDKTAAAIVRGQPYSSYDDFVERSGADSGVEKILIRLGAFNQFVPNRRELELSLERFLSGESKRCVFYEAHKVGAPNDLPCNFDWSSEPVTIGKLGRPIKGKPIPQKCTVRCRHYTAPTAEAIHCEPYTNREIMTAEMEYLGVHISHTPFDGVRRVYGNKIARASDCERAPMSDRGIFVAGLVMKVSEFQDKKKRKMGRVSLFVQDGQIDAVCFASEWDRLKPELKVNELVLATLMKRSRGYQIATAQRERYGGDDSDG